MTQTPLPCAGKWDGVWTTWIFQLLWKKKISTGGGQWGLAPRRCISQNLSSNIPNKPTMRLNLARLQALLLSGAELAVVSHQVPNHNPFLRKIWVYRQTRWPPSTGPSRVAPTWEQLVKATKAPGQQGMWIQPPRRIGLEGNELPSRSLGRRYVPPIGVCQGVKSAIWLRHFPNHESPHQMPV